jgi:hypothetical protein
VVFLGQLRLGPQGRVSPEIVAGGRPLLGDSNVHYVAGLRPLTTVRNASWASWKQPVYRTAVASAAVDTVHSLVPGCADLVAARAAAMSQNRLGRAGSLPADDGAGPSTKSGPRLRAGRSVLL